MPSPSAIAWLNLLTARIVIGSLHEPSRTSIVSAPMRTSVALAIVLILAGAAQAARVVGTAANDRLVGTARADTILGREGRDRLVGNAGADFLNGGAGSDIFDAGPGADRIVVQYDGATDTVRCGPGSDLVNADLIDRVGADCELVGRRLSRDPYTGPEAQHESEVEPDSLTVGRTTVAAFQVGRRFSGAADNIGFAVSSDNGSTWRSGLLPGLTTVSVPAGPERTRERPGRRLRRRRSRLAHRDARARGAGHAPHRQPLDGRSHVERAGDGDRGLGDDRDRLRQELDRLRQRAVQPQSRPLLPRLHRHAPRRPARGDRLHRRRRDLVGAGGNPGDRRSRRVPGDPPVRRARRRLPLVRQPPRRRRSRRTGRSASARPRSSPSSQVRSIRGLRFFPLPSADVDPSGRVWITWHDCRFSSGCAQNSVVVATSSDGRAWSAPSRVTTARDAFLPAIGIHPASGRVAIVYHVVRPAGIDVELVESRTRCADGLRGAAAPLGTDHAAGVVAQHGLRSNARRLPLGALCGRTAARRLDPRLRAGRDGATTGGLRDARLDGSASLRGRSDARPSSARGTPRSPTGSAHQPTSGRRA